MSEPIFKSEDLPKLEEVALFRLRLELYGAAQRLNGAALQKFWDLIEEVRQLRMVWTATLDEQTCDECRERHGRAVGLRDCPPLHRAPDPRGDCRCVIERPTP